MPALFSIIIPTLNEEKYVPNLLGDLEKQENKDFEVHIVDAHSDDETVEKAKRFASGLRLKVWNVERRDSSSQRNYGAKKSTGSILVFIDADCRVYPDFIKNIHDYMQKTKCRAITPWMEPDDKNVFLRLYMRVGNYIGWITEKCNIPLCTVGAFIVEKALFWSVEGYDETFFVSEDHELFKQIKNRKIKVPITRSIKIIFSLRRMRNEGFVTSVYKMIYAILYFLSKGDVKEHIFTYEKGGRAHQSLK